MVVVARSGSGFAELTRIADYMLRRVHPDCELHLVVDPETEKCLFADARTVLDSAAAIHVVDAEGTTPREKAWGLKTRVRQIVPGDFLLLDLDALVVRPLDRIFSTECDVAAVLDRHLPIAQYTFPLWEREMFAQYGWAMPPHYVNSGVVYFRDTPLAHRVGQEWEENWRKARTFGRTEDQPVFNAAIGSLHPHLRLLDAGFNAQFQNRLSVLRHAAIIHVFTIRMKGRQDNVLAVAVRRVLEKGILDTQLLDRFAKDRYPWVDEWASALFACGQYRRAVVQSLRSATRKCGRWFLG